MYIVKKVWRDKHGNEEFEYLSGFYTSKEKAKPFIDEYEERYKSFFEDISEVKTEFIEITDDYYFAVIRRYTGGRIDDLYGVFDGQYVIDFLTTKEYLPDKKTDVYVIPLTIDAEFKGYTNTF